MTYQEKQIGAFFLDIIRNLYEKHPEFKNEKEHAINKTIKKGSEERATASN